VAARYAETVARRRPTGGSYSFVMDRKLRQCQCLRVPLSDDGKTIDKIIAVFILTAPPPAD